MADRTNQCALVFAECRSGGYDIDRILWDALPVGVALVGDTSGFGGFPSVGDGRYIELLMSSYCLSHDS